MEHLKSLLIEKAIKENKEEEVVPAGTKRYLHECFTIEDNKLCFWFNLKSQETTKLLIREIN